MPSQEHVCDDCGARFIRYTTLRRFCDDCTRARANRRPLKPRRPLPRSQKPLQRSRRRIKQRGKVATKDAIYRETVVRPYLDKNFGIACANCGAMPPLLDSGLYSRHAIDHIQGKGPHPELRYVVTNFQYLCVPCHEEKTGKVQWSLRQA